MDLNDKELLNIESNLLPVETYDSQLLRCVDKNEIEQDNDGKKRFTQYTLADAKCHDDYLDFYSNNADGIFPQERKEMFNFLSLYITGNEITSDVLDTLPNINRFLIKHFPCKFGAFVGAAGTGKTTASANMMFKMTQMTACGATNSAYSTFLGMLEENIKPGSYRNIMKETVYKLLNINCEDGFIQEAFKKLNSNAELRNSYCNIIQNPNLIEDETKSQEAISNHIKIVLKALHPIICFTIDKLIRLFSKYWVKYRLNINNVQHPFYQSKEESFSFITKDIKKKSTNNKLCESVNCIEGYKIFIQSVFDKQISLITNNIHLPPILILSDSILVEEAGRLPAYFNTFISFIWYFLNFTFNTPYLHLHKIPFIVTSGSDTQSNVIDFPYSMLDEIISPCFIWNRKTVLPYKSDHNRRKINAFSDLKTSMHNVACLSLENFMISDLTFRTFMFSETFTELVNDPRIKPNAIRMYGYHTAVEQYIDKIHTNGNANIETWDCVFISSDITLINSDDFDGCYEERALSSLTEEQAKQNRLNMWKKKRNIFSSDKKESCIINDEIYKENYTCNTQIKTDKGFDKDVEKVILEIYKKLENSSHLKKNKKQSKYKFEHYLTSQELDEIEYGKKITSELNGFAPEFNNTSVKQDIRYICGLAKNMLSSEEHKIKRMHGKGIADEIGYGLDLTKSYYSFAGAQGQTTQMEYDPNYDLCIEIADPDYSDGNDITLSKSLEKTVNTRTVFMCMKRKRYFAHKAYVVTGMSRTYFKHIGVLGKINNILLCESFTTSNLEFRLLVYCGILYDYKKWVYASYVQDEELDVDVLNLNDENLASFGETLNIPHLEKMIIKKFDDVMVKCKNKLSKEFKYEKDDRYELDVLEIHNIFKRLVGDCVDTSQEFAEKDFQYDIESCPLLNTWPKLFYKALSPVVYLSADLQNGNLIVLGPGMSTLNNKNEDRRALLWEKNMIGKKNVNFILNDAIERLFPDLTAKSTLKVLIKGNIIANTYSSLSHKHIKISNVLLQRKKNGETSRSSKYGQMMRLTTANFSTDVKKLMHKIYSINGRECMNFPRPFRIEFSKYPSNIILKCSDNKIYPYSKLLKIDTNEPELFKRKNIEAFAIVALMNPLFVGGASTVDSMQGKTTSGQTMVDLGNMDSSKYLVAITRNDSSHNLFTSNVTEARQNKNLTDSFNQYKIKTKKLISKYFYFR